MSIKNFASDLHRKGELSKIEEMEKLANEIEKRTNGGLSGAYLTNGVYDKYDVVAMIANEAAYQNQQGYVFYDNAANKAVFITDEELEEL